jgi:hypothetical protein
MVSPTLIGCRAMDLGQHLWIDGGLAAGTRRGSPSRCRLGLGPDRTLVDPALGLALLDLLAFDAGIDRLAGRPPGADLGRATLGLCARLGARGAAGLLVVVRPPAAARRRTLAAAGAATWTARVGPSA